MQSFFWSVFSHIQSEYWKIRTRKNSYVDSFHIVTGALTVIATTHMLKIFRYDCPVNPNSKKVQTIKLKRFCDKIPQYPRRTTEFHDESYRAEK